MESTNGSLWRSLPLGVLQLPKAQKIPRSSRHELCYNKARKSVASENEWSLVITDESLSQSCRGPLQWISLWCIFVMDLSQVAPASQEHCWALQYCGAQGPDGAVVGIPPALSEKRVIRGSLLDEAAGQTPALSKSTFEGFQGERKRDSDSAASH